MKISKISMAILAATAILAVSPAVLAQTDTNKPAGDAQPPRAGGARGGGMITIEMGGYAAAKAMLDRVRVMSFAESLGGVESLISHPASMTHASVPA